MQDTCGCSDKQPAPPPAEAHIYYRQQIRKCGNKTCKKCTVRGEGHGPYWYMFWREDGKLRTRYIGKSLPEGVEPPSK